MLLIDHAVQGEEDRVRRLDFGVALNGSREGGVDRLHDQLRPQPQGAHGLGGGGERGLGAGEGRRDSIERGELALTLALSKSLGVAGGAVLVAPDLAASLRRDSSCYAGTTPILPAIAAAARAGLALLSDDATLVGRMRANAARVRALLASHGWLDGAGPALPVAGVAAPGGRDVRELSEALAAHGVYVPVVGYAGGPASTWLRFAASAAHSGSDLHALERALAAVT